MIFSSNVDPNWVKKIHEQNQITLQTLRHWRYDDTVLLEDGGMISVQVAISPILSDANVCLGTIVAITDVSELTEAKSRAEAAANSKSTFLANMSHEIRTPMNAIKGFSELLALTEMSDLQRNYVNNILSSANSLISIINDILDFSKIDANRLEIIENEYSVAKMLSEVVNAVSLRAEEKGLSFIVDAPVGLPSTLYGDDVRIRQIVINMLSNAVKYTESGQVALSVRFEKRNDKNYLKAIVEDTGVGIRQADLPNLFDAFARCDLMKNRSIMGTGLGLAISKQLALLMRGNIFVSSEYGKGSTFVFEVPQEIISGKPLARLPDPGTFRALLLGEGPRIQNVGDMLHQLGVPAITIEEVGESDETAEIPGKLHTVLQEGKNGGYAFTHCLFTDGVSAKCLEWLREKLIDCRFAMLRSMKQSAETPVQNHDAILFIPLLAFDLVKFLKQSESNTGKKALKKDKSPDKPTGSSVIIPRFANCDVLVVDDNKVNLLVCDRMLKLYGVAAVCVGGGQEALDKCQSKKFDLIFLDHMMPEIDGLEVAKRLHSEPGLNRNTPLIALTANVINGMREYYLHNGMDDFIAKPIERGELTRVLMQWLPAAKFAR